MSATYKRMDGGCYSPVVVMSVWHSGPAEGWGGLVLSKPSAATNPMSLVTQESKFLGPFLWDTGILPTLSSFSGSINPNIQSPPTKKPEVWTQTPSAPAPKSSGSWTPPFPENNNLGSQFLLLGFQGSGPQLPPFPGPRCSGFHLPSHSRVPSSGLWPSPASKARESCPNFLFFQETRNSGPLCPLILGLKGLGPSPLLLFWV